MRETKLPNRAIWVKEGVIDDDGIGCRLHAPQRLRLSLHLRVLLLVKVAVELLHLLDKGLIVNHLTFLHFLSTLFVLVEGLPSRLLRALPRVVTRLIARERSSRLHRVVFDLGRATIF